MNDPGPMSPEAAQRLRIEWLTALDGAIASLSDAWTQIHKLPACLSEKDAKNIRAALKNARGWLDNIQRAVDARVAAGILPAQPARAAGTAAPTTD
jgi:hypothetical protein